MATMQQEFGPTQLRLVTSIARHLCRERRGYGFEDMVGYGAVGLLEAGQRYRPGQVGFSTFAYHRIRGAILDGRRKARWYHKGPGFIPTKPMRKKHEPRYQTTTETRADLAQLRGALPARERRILELVWLEGYQMVEVARAWGLSKSWLSRIHDRALRHAQELAAA